MADTIETTSPRTVGEVVTKIKNRARRSCGTILMEYPLTDDDENTAPDLDDRSSPEWTPGVKRAMPKLEKQVESPATPFKRRPGRPKLTEEERTSKSKSKSKSKKRNRSKSEDSGSNSEGETFVEIKKTGPQKYSRAAVIRSSSTGTPKKIRGRIDPEGDEFSDLTELMKRQSISPAEAKRGTSQQSGKSSPSPSARKTPPSSSKITSVKTANKKQEPNPVVLTPPHTGLQVKFLLLPSAVSFVEKYFIKARGCFLIRNYFKMRTYMKRLTRTSVRKLKPRAPRSVLMSRARLESVVGKLNKQITAYFRVAVQPAERDEVELNYAIEHAVFLRRNYLKVRKNSSIATVDLTKKVASKKKNEGKGRELVAEFFQEQSVGFHRHKGSNENPLVLALP